MTLTTVSNILERKLAPEIRTRVLDVHLIRRTRRANTCLNLKKHAINEAETKHNHMPQLKIKKGSVKKRMHKRQRVPVPVMGGHC